MVLMNEFGEEGIDGTLIEDPDLELVEISRGSIFCACVNGDYIKALYRIAFVIKPQLLVIEASGVANPSDLERDLANPVYKDQFATPVHLCIVDAENFLEQYEIFYAIEKQIQSTGRFIINKVDLATPASIAKVKEVILSHNPDATFVETTYARVGMEDLFAFAGGPPAKVQTKAGVEQRLLTDEELEQVIDEMLEDQAAQVTPPDRLSSLACRWRSGTLADFQFIAERVPQDVVRAKGFIFEDGHPYLYSHVGRQFEILPYDGRVSDRPGLNRVVFIRTGFETEDILSMFAQRNLELTT
jgi:G3E family GTPase